MTTNEPAPDLLRQRVVDHSNRDARLAVAEVAARCPPLRARLAVMAARAERSLNDAERSAFLDECTDIQKTVEGARTDLILALMDAPAKVAGHSRVLDIEKAIDNLEAAVSAVRACLTGKPTALAAVSPRRA